MFAHAGLSISRSTLMQWVAGSAALLGPLVEALARHVLRAGNINADDTPVKVLALGTGKTKKGHVWTYVRDGTRWGSKDPPAVWYRYSPDWKGAHPQQHLAAYEGKLQVDDYAGFEPLFLAKKPGVPARIVEIACWAHARRDFYELLVANSCPTSREALERIGQLYDIETLIRGQSAEARLAARQEKSVPILKDLHAWMVNKAAQTMKGSALRKAFNYALKNWLAFTRYT